MVLLTGDNISERASEFLTMVSTRFYRAVVCDRCDAQLLFLPSADNEGIAMALAEHGWVPGYDPVEGNLVLCPNCREA